MEELFSSHPRIPQSRGLNDVSARRMGKNSCLLHAPSVAYSSLCFMIFLKLIVAFYLWELTDNDRYLETSARMRRPCWRALKGTVI